MSSHCSERVYGVNMSLTLVNAGCAGNVATTHRKPYSLRLNAAQHSFGFIAVLESIAFAPPLEVDNHFSRKLRPFGWNAESDVVWCIGTMRLGNWENV